MLRECIREKKVKYNAETHTFTFWNGSTIECAYCATHADLEHFQGIEYDINLISYDGSPQNKVLPQGDNE